MATPLISGDRNAQAYLAEQYRREHQYSLFAWQQRMSKKEAHAEAWRRLMAERDRQRQIAEYQRRQQNQIIR